MAYILLTVPATSGWVQRLLKNKYRNEEGMKQTKSFSFLQNFYRACCTILHCLLAFVYLLDLLSEMVPPFFDC